MIRVSVWLPTDALCQHLPSYLDFSYLAHGLSLHVCSREVQQPLLLTLDMTSLPLAAPALPNCPSQSCTTAAACWNRTGIGKFNSGDHYIYYYEKESLRRNGVALTANERVLNAVLQCNLKSNQMISVHFQSKPFNITVILVYAHNH